MSTPEPQPQFPDRDGIEASDFLERALIAASEWTRHADPKAIAVLVLLGLGSKDLVDHSGRLAAPHEPQASRCDLIDVTGHTCGGLIATSAALAAALLAAVVVLFVSQALFPRLKMRGLLPGDHEKGPITSRDGAPRSASTPRELPNGCRTSGSESDGAEDEAHCDLSLAGTGGSVQCASGYSACV